MPSIADQLLLTRGDLLTFQKDTVDLILEMQKEGWFGQRNSQGHVKMLAPDGKTHVMATSNKNAATYVRQGWNQYKKRAGEEETKVVSEKKPQKWPCARPSCPKVYATEQQLNTHIAVDHEKQVLCEYTNCFEVRDDKRKLSIHMTHAHGYVSPRKAQRKKQEANRKAKADTTETEESTGRAIKDHMFRNVDPSGVKFDPSFVGDFIERSSDQPIIRDTIDAKAIVEDGTGLKHLVVELPLEVLDSQEVFELQDMEEEERTVAAQKIWDDAEEVMIGGVRYIRQRNQSYENWARDAERGISSDGEAVNREFVQYVEAPKGVTPEEIYRHTRNQLNALHQQEEPLEFIDERDSWTLDLETIMDMDIRTVARVLNAAGLKLEMRSWVADKGD